MKDKFYGDKRDLVKWGGIVYLCQENSIKTVFQVTYYHQSKWEKIDFNRGKSVPLPEDVSRHFRCIKDIRRLGRRANLDIQVFNREFKNNKKDREEYHKEICKEIERPNKLYKKKIVFLDPDKGLKPKKTCTYEHVRPNEVKLIWKSLKPKDFLVFYQHKPWFSKKGWKEDCRHEFATRCGLKDVRMWSADGIAKDVVFYFVEKKKR